MSRQWTENQKLAIDARNGSLLVSAAAGSGKTAVLVERVVLMVSDSENPIPIERLLIVTYTRAAAAELKERISKTLNELILKHPENRWYRRQLMYLPKAKISTVDAFCGDIVREFFQKLNIPRDYRIADDSELAIYKEEAVSRTFDHFYAQNSSDFHHLLETFATKNNTEEMKSVIYALYEFLRSHPFEKKWLDEKLSYYTEFTSCSESVWGKVVIDYVKGAVDYCIDVINTCHTMGQEEPELYAKIVNRLSDDRNFLELFREKLSEKAPWDTLCTVASSFSAGRFVANGFTDHPLKLKIAASRSAVVEIIRMLQKLFSRTEEEIKNEIQIQTPLVCKIFEFLLVYNEYYSALKISKNVADFSDIVHWTLDLLVECDENGNPHTTEIAKLISDRFDEVMVDEFQDANEVQDLIYKAVSHEGTNLFVVGDVKQSIYAFRQAMPEIFLSRKNSLELYSREKDNYPSKVILEKNFRSRSEVTDFINFVFASVMSTEVGDMEYTKEEQLVPAAPYEAADAPCNEYHLLDLDKIGDIDTEIAEARYIASLILEKCKTMKIKDGETKRELRFGDIAILMRSTKKYADIYANELRRCGIPVTTESTSGFLSSEEVRVALDFLRIIDNPLQDIPLMSVMLSAVYGFTIDEISLIRAENKYTSLYMNVKKSADNGDVKSKKLLDDISDLRNLSLTMPSDAFIGLLYDKTGLLPIAQATGGELAYSNLCLLKEYANSYEQGLSKGVQAFICYVDRLVENKKDMAPATSSNPESDNVVRIMTIHKSKGLEFPLCIIANTNREFSSDVSKNVLMHSKLGFVAKYRDENLMCTYETFTRDAVALETMRNERSEEIRVLYVALTRAKENLVMVTTKPKLQKYVSNIAATLADTTKISPFTLRSSSLFSDWLVMIALQHPDAENLRDFAGMEKKRNFACPDTNNFVVKFVDSINYDFSSQSNSVSKTVAYEETDKDAYSVIKERFDALKYPQLSLCNLPQKVTASALTHKDMDRKFSRILQKPKFMSAESLTAAERGTAMHTFMQYCDFESALKDVKAEIERLVLIGRLSEKQAEAIDTEKLTAFLESDIVKWALSASEYHREYRFTVNIPAQLVDENIDETLKSHPVILQGAVDLAIVTEDGIIIVDYKTDRVKSMDELKERYKIQLDLYANALSQTMDKPILKSLIYSIHLSDSMEV